jgi:hypothetical protein
LPFHGSLLPVQPPDATSNHTIRQIGQRLIRPSAGFGKAAKQEPSGKRAFSGVTPTEFEQSPDSAEKQSISRQGGTESGSLTAATPDIQVIVDAWPHLPNLAGELAVGHVEKYPRRIFLIATIPFSYSPYKPPNKSGERYATHSAGQQIKKLF